MQERSLQLKAGEAELIAKVEQLELEDAEQMGLRGYSTVASDLAILRAELREIQEEISKGELPW